MTMTDEQVDDALRAVIPGYDPSRLAAEGPVPHYLRKAYRAGLAAAGPEPRP